LLVLKVEPLLAALLRSKATFDHLMSIAPSKLSTKRFPSVSLKFGKFDKFKKKKKIKK
jgi:hypothetical protein